jgi:hypothetical protein
MGTGTEPNHPGLHSRDNRDPAPVTSDGIWDRGSRCLHCRSEDRDWAVDATDYSVLH